MQDLFFAGVADCGLSCSGLDVDVDVGVDGFMAKIWNAPRNKTKRFRGD